MHSRRAALACLMGALSSAEAPGAELLPEPAVRGVKGESLRLIIQDFRAREEAQRTRPARGPAAEGGEVLDLPKMVVTEKKPPDLTPPPKEPKLQEFFRTGTIWEARPGGVKLWMKGDKGLMLTLPF
jgi:hypothetical protein